MGCENWSAALRMSCGGAGSRRESDCSKHRVFCDVGHYEDQSHKQGMHKCYCDLHYYLIFVQLNLLSKFEHRKCER